MRYVVALLWFFACASGAFAQNVPERHGAIPGYLIPLGYCQLSVTSTSAVALSSCSNGIPAGTLVSYVSVETAAIRYRDDGTAPTTTAGMPVASGSQLVYSGWQGAIQFIAQSSTATVDVAFYK